MKTETYLILCFLRKECQSHFLFVNSWIQLKTQEKVLLVIASTYNKRKIGVQYFGLSSLIFKEKFYFTLVFVLLNVVAQYWYNSIDIIFQSNELSPFQESKDSHLFSLSDVSFSQTLKCLVLTKKEEMPNQKRQNLFLPAANTDTAEHRRTTTNQ